MIEIKILGEKKANVPLVFFGPRGRNERRDEDVLSSSANGGVA